MAVFKATENKKQTGNGKFKATQYKSFDSTLVYEWESKNKDSLNSLNNYFTKINNGEYLTVDDLEVYKKSLNSYIDTTSRLRGLNKTFGDGYNEEDEKKWTDAITSLQTDYDNASKFYSSFKTENDFARYQNGIKLRDDALNAEDFKEYSKLGIEKGVDTDFKWATTKHGQLELFSNVHNDMIITYRENPDLVADLADVSGGRTYAADALNYARLMTDEEYGIYTYYYGKDKGLAKDYLKSIEATLNSRQADKIVDSIGDNGFLKMAFGLYAGLDQYISGVENLFSDEDYYVPSASQIASGDIRESLADDGFKILGNSIGQIGYDLLNTTANMLPSILVGTVTGSIGGLATMGVSVYGNSYAEMINLGYNKGQAAAYATLTTAAELGLQSVLGGISSLGGSKSLSKMALNALDSVDNAIGRVALKMGTSMFSEGIEEAAQSVLEPVFKAIVTRGEEWDGIDWGEVAYSGLLGALSAGVLESVPTIVKDRQTVKAGQQVLKVEGVETLKDIGNKFAANTVAYQLAGKVDENTGAYKIGRLLHEVNATLTEQNKTDIVEALKSNNIKPEDAKVIAEALGAVVDGVELTKKQQAVLDGNEIASKVFADVIVNQNSTYNQRMAGYIELQKAMESGTKLTPKEKGVNNATETFESTDSSSEVKTAQESQFSHHDDGKTIYKGEEVSVKEISSIKDGAVTVRLEDGREVDAKEIDFGSEDEALMYEMVASMGVTPETAKYMMDTYNTGKGTVSISDYRADAPLAYQSGKIGYVRGTANLRLTDMQKLDLFARGRKDATAEAEAKQSHMDKNRVDASKSENTTKKSGRVTYLDGAKPSGSRQKSTVKLIEILSESIGNNWYVFSSYVENGRRVYKDKDGRIKAAPNGMYDTTTGDIYIDLHAGQNGEGLMIFTMAHELTHFIRQWSPEKFKVFADFLVEQYGEKGVSVDQLIQRKIDNAKAKGRELSYDNAYEEVIADSCETMLRDSNAIDAIAKLKAKDQTVWEKIKDFISRLVEKIRAAYAKLDPDSVEGRMVLEMKEAAEQLQALWTEALVDAGETYRETLSNNGIMVDSNTESASLYSVRDLLDSKQQQQVAKALAERFDVTVEEAKNWISAETSLASIILNPKYSQYLDYTADPNEVAIKKNSDYPQGTVDFSNICKKRRDFTEVMNRVLRKFPNHVFEATDLAKIRTIMSEENMEVACGICYVEDRRQLDSVVAQDFINSLALYREGSKTRPDGAPFNTNQLKALKLIDGDTYTPSIYELISLEGRNSLKAKNPAMEQAWVKFNNARGMQSVRLLLNDAEYKRQILKYSPDVVKRKNDLGGLRIYSFSDMEMFHLIDIIQVITDSAMVGLSIQGYTKVNEYARAVKDTGEKLNRSLIPKGDLGYHMEDGKVVLDYDTVEGIDINHPDFFDSTDNPDVGNIVIGINETQIKAAMVSEFIDYIIPFHTGQSKEVLGEKGIAEWHNYEDSQSERDLATGKKSSHQINIYTEVIHAAEKEGEPITNKVEFVNKFIAVCKENGLKPRFSEFLNTGENGDYVYTEGYHKFLVDFKTFDSKTGEYLPQKPVKPIFDNKYLMGILKDYVKSQQLKDSKFAETMPTVLDRITNEIVKSGIKYSDRVTDKETLDFLENQEHVTVYRAMQLIDEKLYPPMNAYTYDESGKKVLMPHSEIGAWEQAVERPDLIDPKTGKFKLDKGKVDGGKKGTSVAAAYNPYIHTSLSMLNDQFTSAYTRSNLVVVKGVVPKSELTSGYHAQYAKDSVGETEWHSGVVSTQLPESRKVILSRWFKPVEIMDNDVVAQNIKKMLGNTGIEIPYNVVSPKLRRSLEEIGVPIGEGRGIRNLPSKNDVKYSDRDSAGNQLSEEQQEFFKDSKVRDGKGRLQVVYHGTTSEFNTFKRGDIGYHFGSYAQARDRLSYQGGKKRYIKAYLDIKNPLVIEHDSGSWHGNYAAGMLLAWGDFDSNPEIVEKLQKIAKMYDTRKSDVELKNFLKSLGYDGIQYLNTHEGGFGKESYSYMAFDSNQIKLVENKAPTSDPDIRYSDRDLAPTFYSQMGKVVEGIKQDKFAADSVIPMLRGRGIKAEEIRWSGIATFLEGKKSVTKQELQEFIAGSQLQIGEQMSGNDIDLRYNAGERSYTLYDKSGNVIDTYIYNEFMEGYVSELDDEVYSDANELEDAVREEYGEMSSPRWSEYKLDGGKNYREIVFTMPNSTYTNSAMKGHWGQDAEGVLVHARIQDFDVKGKKMLFIEELQSDWHNEGHSKGYSTKEYEDAVETHDKLYNEYKKLDLAFHKYIRSNEYMTDPEDVRKKKHDWLRRKAETAQKKYLEAEKVVSSLKEKGAGDTPDAPFKDTYHEYVLKRLLRMAAEQGYDSIGWTPADIQSKRWSDEYAEGYRIEYDQDMPKFLKKYSRQWGARVEKSKAPNGEEIWSMDITDSMKDSVLHEGQMLYSDRGVNKYGIEVYETSEKTKNLSYTERKNAFLEIMQNQYRGRTAKFIRNGHAYYARFEEADVRKNIYGDNRSDRKGIKAKVNVGADGNIFELVENAQYDGSKQEKGKTTLAHQQVAYWDYFIKTVQIDNKVFDLLANVRKKSDGGYVYSIQLNENKKVEASPPLIPIKGVSNRVLNASTDDILPQESKVVKQNSEKSQKNSDRDPDSVSNRSLLANALETAAQNDIERNKLAQYKQKIDLIEAEEAKLHELREEIKELSFANGRRDTEKIKRLQFEANQTANRINTYDRQLLNLEASKPLKAVLEREKAMAYKKAEQRGKEALAAYRERTAKTTRELMTRYQESRAKATEGRHKTEIRHKIKDVVSKLNQLLLRPTKDKHIKEGLRMAVAEALAVINMDTIGADERVAKYNELIAKTSDPDMIAELTRTRDRIELQGENLKDKLTALQSAYEKIKNSTDDDLKNAYQEAVMNTIKNVSEMVGNTSIRDMSLTQLEAVYEMYTMVLHTVRIANKMFKAEKGETITQTAEAVNEEVRTIGKEKFARNRFAAWLRETGWTLLKPFTAFRTIGSDTFTKLYTELRKGEDVFYEDVNEAKNFIQEKYKKYNFKSWDKKITKTFTAKSGKTFTLNLEQMMSLYAYSRRTQAHDHIIEGGIVLEDSVIEEKNKLGITMKYKVDTKTAFNISEETLDEICDSLTKEQRGFVDEMQAYLSDVMGAKGNEVSMELLGVKLFKEKFYFPLKSSKYYMGFKPEEAGEIKLKNPAFSKETVQHANNPVVLKDFTDVWATHINDMSMYHAFVLALEDFTRVYNYKTKTAENVETMSTEATIANAYGEGATEYIRNFLKSLNGGVRTENVGWADKMLSLSKKSAVLASTSVAIQQPSAIMRAMALIDPKHFVATTHKSINLLKHKQDWAELKTYAPIAGIKEMGRFDVGMGQSTVEWIKDQKTVMEKVDDTLGKAPQFMDEVTWVSIWNAVKRETASKNKGMDVTSEAFLKKAGERFTEVISLTQVYDSVFSRSDIMRNKSFAAKSLTAFMAEPTTTMNMMVDSIVQGKRGDKSVTAKTIGAISASILVNSALVALVYAARDDDEDETYLEKYLGSLTSELVDGFNPITYIPIVKDIWSIMQGYDIERSDMSLISNLWESIERLFSKGTVYDKVSDVAGSLAALFGIPVKNILREVETIYNLFGLISNDTPTTELGIKYAVSESAKDSIPLWGRFSKNKSNYDKLYDAIISGDQEQLERVKGRFDFENKNEYASALRKAIRENDPRIKKAAQAVIDGNHSERIRLTKEIVAEGHFTQDIVVGAINNELAYLREKLKEKK